MANPGNNTETITAQEDEEEEENFYICWWEKLQPGLYLGRGKKISAVPTL